MSRGDIAQLFTDGLKRLKLSDAQLAKMIGVDRKTIWSWRNGQSTSEIEHFLLGARVLGWKLSPLRDVSAPAQEKTYSAPREQRFRANETQG